MQVEGFVMCAEPEVLFGNLDELCCVTYAFCKEFINLLIDLVTVDGKTLFNLRVDLKALFGNLDELCLVTNACCII